MPCGNDSQSCLKDTSLSKMGLDQIRVGIFHSVYTRSNPSCPFQRPFVGGPIAPFITSRGPSCIKRLQHIWHIYLYCMYNIHIWLVLNPRPCCSFAGHFVGKLVIYSSFALQKKHHPKKGKDRLPTIMDFRGELWNFGGFPIQVCSYRWPDKGLSLVKPGQWDEVYRYIYRSTDERLEFSM